MAGTLPPTCNKTKRPVVSNSKRRRVQDTGLITGFSSFRPSQALMHFHSWVHLLLVLIDGLCSTITHVSSVQVFVLGHKNQMSLGKCLLDSNTYIAPRLGENGLKISVSVRTWACL